VAPLTQLTRKDQPFAWTDRCESSFQELKQKLTSAPVLVIPDTSRPFEVYCDASQQGLGCVLMQERRVVAYASRQLKSHEKNYPTHDLELAAVVFALKMWRHYLYGAQFQVFSDHKSLKYLFDQKELNMRQRRWMEFLKDFDFELLYHPGKANVVADALSRKTVHASYMMARELELVEQFRDMQLQVTLGEGVIRCNRLIVSSDFLVLIKERQLSDPKLRETAECLGTEKAKDFEMGGDGVLRFRGRVCIPEDLEVKGMILEEGHKSRFSMHPGMTKMYHDLRESFWWTGMKSDIARYVSSCLTCQKAKTEHQRPGGMLQQLEIPGDEILPLVEFTYNNSFHTSIGMAPYEALYGRRCRTPLCWYQDRESVVVGPELLRQTTEKVKQIQGRMKASQSRQESYADQRRRPLEFAVGDHVFLRITPTTGVGRAIRSRKLSPKFIGPYQILRKIGPVAYEIALPPQLSNLHSVFHASQLRKYVSDPSHVLESEDLQIRGDLSVEVQPVSICDRQTRQRKGKSVSLVQVIWDRRTGDSTWELEKEVRESYPHLFSGMS